MENKEKLDNFLNICIEDASKRSEELIEKHTRFTSGEYSKKAKQVEKDSEQALRLETEALNEEYNILLSREQSRLKSEYLEKRKEYEDMIFNEVYNMLDNFTTTTDYIRYIEDQIREARPIAGDEKMILIIGDADLDIARDIAIRNKTEIRLSDENFGGGCMILIPSRNMLIDCSFKNKLQKIRANFHFDLNEQV